MTPAVWIAIVLAVVIVCLAIGVPYWHTRRRMADHFEHDKSSGLGRPNPDVRSPSEPLSARSMRRGGTQPRTAGLSTSSHHWRKLVGVVASGVRGSRLSRPSSLATAMSSMPCAMASDIPAPVSLAL
jgi:hypothetical protein